MANDEHVALLKKGVDAWNAWRDESPNTLLDLSGANLHSEHLRGRAWVAYALAMQTSAGRTSEGARLRGLGVPSSRARSRSLYALGDGPCGGELYGPPRLSPAE